MIPLDDTLTSAVMAAADSAERISIPAPAVDSVVTASSALPGCMETATVVYPHVDTLSAAERCSTIGGWLSDWTEGLRTASSLTDVSAVELFGPASTRCDSVAAAAPMVETLAQTTTFQIVVLLFAAFYLLVLYADSSEVQLLVDSFGFDRNAGQRILGKRGIFHSQFLRRYSVLGAVGLGVLTVKLCDEWMPAGSFSMLDPLVRQGFGILVMLVIEVIFLVQAAVLWGVGQVTLSQSFISTLLYVKQVHFARAVLLVQPLILLSVLCPPGSGMVWIYLIFTLIAAAVLMYLREAHALFVAKKISNLHWFLYLCTIETAPIAFAVLMLIKHS